MKQIQTQGSQYFILKKAKLICGENIASFFPMGLREQLSWQKLKTSDTKMTWEVFAQHAVTMDILCLIESSNILIL